MSSVVRSGMPGPVSLCVTSGSWNQRGGLPRHSAGAQPTGARTRPPPPAGQSSRGPRPPQLPCPHWPALRPPLGSRAVPFRALVGLIVMTVRAAIRLRVWRMGGASQEGVAGGRRGVRRRVVGDAESGLLLGNQCCRPAPSGLLVPLTDGTAGPAAQDDMPVRFKVRPGARRRVAGTPLG